MSERIDFAQISFLVVDANPLAIELVHDILKMLGAGSIRHARDAERALASLTEEPIDIVITEWMLEKGSGLDLIEEIRRGHGSIDRQTPIIMLTANSEMEFVIKARDAGVTEFLAKPFSVESLYRRLVSVIARPRPFVVAPAYFGPDRRRRQLGFAGPERRARPAETKAG